MEIAGRLASPDDRFVEWAESVGVVCGPLDLEEKNDLIYELDAVVAHLYGLNEQQLIHIFETFHKGWNYDDRLEGVRHHFQKWQSR